MATLPILEPPGTGAIPNTPIPSYSYQYIMFAAALTADTIVVNAYLPDGQGLVPMPDINGVLTGLATGHQVRIYPGGPDYVLVRTGSADTVGVYAIFGGRVE